MNGVLNDGLSSVQRLFGFDFYLALFNGVKTDTVAQLALWFSPFFMSYPFLKSGIEVIYMTLITYNINLKLP